MTTSDPTLQKVAELIQSDDWPQISHEKNNIEDLKSFSRIKDELTVSEDSTNTGDPRVQCPVPVENKTTTTGKNMVPSAVKQLIDNCVTCQANGPENHPDPL